MKVLFIIFFFSVRLYSQDIDYLKSQDTLYLVLEESDKDLVIKDGDITYRVYGNSVENQYHFAGNNKKMIYFTTFKSNQNNGKFNLEVKRKDFFRKNKNKVIDFHFIKKHGLRISFIDILVRPKRKIIYVINSNEIKKRKLTLKKTIIGDGAFMSD